MSNLHQLADYSGRMAAGDYDAVYEHFARHFFSHVTERVNPEAQGSDIRHREREFWEMAGQAFSDLRFDVNLVLETGDYVVSNWTLTGVHSGGHYYDVAPTGRAVTINGTAILRFEDGVVVEHWGGPHCMRGVGLTPA